MDDPIQRMIIGGRSPSYFEAYRMLFDTAEEVKKAAEQPVELYQNRAARRREERRNKHGNRNRNRNNSLNS